ncbi:MAG: hypothetical protein KBC17_01725 [Candidatus Pacebacteria bacterium]|nr:hypothetical protein [Candidatus Paceibacterota bacterium]
MCDSNKECSGGVCKIDDKGCCGGYSHKRMIKWAIKIAILLIVACVSFQLGEIKGSIHSMYKMHRGGMGGHGMMYGNYSWNDEMPLSGKIKIEKEVVTPAN